VISVTDLSAARAAAKAAKPAASNGAELPEPPEWMDEAPPIEEELELAAVGADSGQRQEIHLMAGALHIYADTVERLITSDVYVRGQKLARIGTAPELAVSSRADIKRADDQRVIVPVSPEYLKRRLASLADFQKFDRRGKKWYSVDCPGDLVTNIIGYGDWQNFRPLEAIATAPFLRSDLSVCSTPGYDPASRVYFAPNAEFPPMPESPNKDDADAALERLLEPFKEFPFATEEAKAAFLSHILTAAARHAIDTRPIFTYTAPLAATGKTLLAGMPVRIADGTEPGMKPFTDESEEIRKVLMSVLLAGDSAIYFDNVPAGTKVRSAILCAFVTAPVYSDRKLGVSESPTLPNRCQIVLTGNNVSPTGDLARRCIVVRLDANAESARGRDFAIADLKAHVRARRPQMLIDALTVICAYALASDPVSLRPLESFETWSRIARDPVAWIGYGDAAATQQLETDDETAPLIDAFEALAARDRFQNAFRASDIATGCNAYDGDDLRHAIEAAGCSDATNAKVIGYWLREHRDQVAGHRKLVQDGKTGGVSRYRLRGI
jgi:hypothetical protein